MEKWPFPFTDLCEIDIKMFEISLKTGFLEERFGKDSAGNSIFPICRK